MRRHGDVMQIPLVGECSLVADPRLTVDRQSEMMAVEDFKGTLYLKQRAVIWAMVALEQRPSLKIRQADTELALEVENGFLTEPFSCGKTVTMLGLICTNTVPQSTVKWRTAGAEVYQDVLPVVEVQFDHFIHATLVLLNKPSIVEWEKNIARFSDKKFTTIQDKRGLRLFEQMVIADDFRGLGDIVLLKVGKVANYFVNTEAGRPIVSNRIMHAMTLLCEGRLWDRVIIDDFDHVGFTQADSLVLGRFNWLISATKKVRTSKPLTAAGDFEDNVALLAANDAGANIDRSIWTSLYNNQAFNLVADGMLGTIYNDGVCGLTSVNVTERDFDRLDGTAIRFNQIVVKGGNGFKLLEELGLEERDLEQFQLTPKNVNEIILAMVEDNVAMIAVLEEAEKQLDKIKISKQSSFAGFKSLVDSLSAAVQKRRLQCSADSEEGAKHDPLVAWMKNHAVTEELRDAAARAVREKRDKLLANTERFRDNIRGGECQVCCVPAARADRGGSSAGDAATASKFYITACCQTVLCPECFLSLVKRVDTGLYCPNCTMKNSLANILCIDLHSESLDNMVTLASAIVEKKDTVRIVSELARHAGQTNPPPRLEAASAVDNMLEYVREMVDAMERDRNVNKLDMLVKLIAGRLADPDPDVVARYNTRFPVPGLLETTTSIPRTDQPRKWLVFMIQNSSTAVVVERLSRAGIFAVSATGTVNQIKTALELYESSQIESVLVLSAEKSSAGLNLQHTTDVVFMQAMNNVETLAQSIARAHRTGRTCNLDVHWLVYSHEYWNMTAMFPVAL